MLYKIISPQGLGIENMDKSHISLQLMGDSVQVFIYAVDAWLNQGKRNNQSQKREKTAWKRMQGVYMYNV